MAHHAAGDGGPSHRLEIEPVVALHLIWTLAIAFIASYPLASFAAFNLCGIDGCGVADVGTAWKSFLLVPIFGALFGLAVGLVPWLFPVRSRVAVAAITGLVPAALLAHLLWQPLAPYVTW